MITDDYPPGFVPRAGFDALTRWHSRALKQRDEQKQRAENAERAVLAERLKWENEVIRLNTQVEALREALKDRETTIDRKLSTKKEDAP